MFQFIEREDKYIRVNNIKYKIKNLLNLEIEEYFNLINFVNINDIKNILKLITNIPDEIIEILDDESFSNIIWKDLFEDFNIKKIKIEELNVGDFNTLIYFSDSDENDNYKYIKLYIYLKYINSNWVKKLYYKYFEFDLFKKYKLIKDKKIKIKKLLPYIYGFQEYRNEIFNGFPAIFKPVIKDGKNKSQIKINNIGLMDIIYSEIYTTNSSSVMVQKLLDEDLYTFLNYYTWKIVQIKKENQAQKKIN